MPKKKIKRVGSLELIMRKGPGTDNPIIRVLGQHTEVELLGQDEEVDNGSWVKIQVGHDIGWVNQRYLDQYPQKLQENRCQICTIHHLSLKTLEVGGTILL